MLNTLTLLSREYVSPNMVRLNFQAASPVFADAPSSDSYIKLVFPADGNLFAEDTNIRDLRASLPDSEQPRVRTYTIRKVDRAKNIVSVDFVTHSGESVAASWAVSAPEGERIQVAGPGGVYVPDAEAHNLFVADDAGLPAALAGIEALPAGGQATLFAEVESPEHTQPVESCGEVEVVWSYRNGSETSDLVDNVLAWDWPNTRVRVFAHGERTTMMRDLRPHFRSHGVGGKDLSVSGYWRRGFDEDAFQAGKRSDPLVAAANAEVTQDN